MSDIDDTTLDELGRCKCCVCVEKRKRSELAAPQGSALLRLLTAASLMRIAIKERATFLTRTTDWERLEDAMRNAERELKSPNDRTELSARVTPTANDNPKI